MNPSLNILHTVENYWPQTGGSELVVQSISERLVARGHKVTVATSRNKERRSICDHNGVHILSFDVNGGLARGVNGDDVGAYLELTDLFPGEIMMNYAAQHWATDLAFPSLGGRRKNKVNIIAPCGYSALLDECTVAQPEYQTYFSDILPNILPLYDAAVYHSSFYKDYEFAKMNALQNSVVIPNGVDEQEFEAPAAVNFRLKYDISTRYMAICVANLFPRKGQERLIGMMRELRRPDLTLVLIGNDHGTLSQLQSFASGLGIKFLTNLPRTDTLAAFKSADLFLFASLVEASPLVIIEAKAAKLPFISTDCGNVKEWQGGIVCDVPAMAANVNALLDDEARRKQLAEAGHREWKERLTWRAVVDQYETLYLALARKKRLIP